jgi:hypothetical protein
VQQLDRSLGMRGGAEAVPLAAQASFDDTFEATVSTMETTAAWPLAAYLPHARVQLKSAAAHALCGRHTAALFGSPAVRITALPCCSVHTFSISERDFCAVVPGDAL